MIGSLGSPALAARGVTRSLELLDDRPPPALPTSPSRRRPSTRFPLDPVFARASAAARADTARCARFYLDATELQPENADSWYRLGLFRLDLLDDACAAWEALNHAYTLDPKSRRWQPGGPLDVARDAVNEGACVS